jgi:ASC-1-like (ASCH) protein
MDHVAVMKKSWGLTEKIVTGQKTLESRWYKTRRLPWDKIKPGDDVYFKDSGGPVRVKAKVRKVLQFDGLSPAKTKRILSKYGKADLGAAGIMPEIREYVSGKNYCILVFLTGAKKIKPFEINKKGYGAMSAWITVDDIKKITKI